MRVVIDTNELLRMAAGGSRSQLGLRWRDHRFDLLISLSTLTELRTVLARPEIQNYVAPAVGDQFLGLLEARAIFVQPDLAAPTCRDPQDSALIATAVGGRADFLITADPDILDDPQLREALAAHSMQVTAAPLFCPYLKLNRTILSQPATVSTIAYNPAVMPPETHYARSGELYIAYQVTGTSSVHVVLAPGTVSHLDLDWESPPRASFFEGLSQFCRLIRFDKRGTGLSDRPLQMATLEERTDDIRAVMDAAGSERAVIFGASEGASMACLFAAAYPSRTRSLIVWGSQARWIRTDDYPWGDTPETHERMVRDVQEHWPSLEYVLGPGAGLGKDVDPAYLEFVMRYMRAAASPSAAAAYERMNGQIDIRPILPSIRVPALVMNRTGDPVASVAAARDLAAHIPGARFVEFPGETHSMMTIEPERVLAEIEEFVTGVRPARNVERILATVLFVDIVESTQRAAALGDAAWRNRLAAYYALARKELARFRGQEIDTAGDGFFAAFDGPARAVRCGLAIVQGVRQLGLEVRAGLHTGECELMGEKLGGLAVHIGARVLSKAGPSEVLVSSTVRDLVAGSGLKFAARGAQVLKGVPGEWQLFAAEG